MKLIFLDIDGVLNSENSFSNGNTHYFEWPENHGVTNGGHHIRFCPLSKRFINDLIDQTGAKVVISSVWRYQGLEYLKKVWELEGMSGEIIGITPRLFGDGFTVPRGIEIEKFLEDRGFYSVFWSVEEQQKYIDNSGIENFIIIDDDSDMMLYQSNHFVNVLPSPRNREGFNQQYFEEAISKLKKTAIELNYR